MRPAKFNEDDEQSRRVMNGPRPSPLRINKDSNLIHKPSHYHKQNPVIIYTQSPKIIHTQPRHFMALVQNLTGLSPSDLLQTHHQTSSLGGKNHMNVPISHDDIGTSFSPIFRTLINDPYFADMPLFTPNSNNFFCTPPPLFTNSDMVSLSPNMGNSMSPSFLELIEGLREY